MILLSFVRFEVEEDNDCSYDSLTIYDGVSSSSVQLEKLCGSFIPRPVTSTSYNLHLKYAGSFLAMENSDYFDDCFNHNSAILNIDQVLFLKQISTTTTDCCLELSQIWLDKDF